MSTTLIALAAGGGLVALLIASLLARALMSAGFTWADALVIEAVALIGIIGAVQSYTALRWLASLGDLPDWQAAVAPATVDLFAAVLGLAALSARRRGSRDRYADWLALCYSVAAVAANLAAAGLDVSQNGITGARVAVVLLAHTAPVVTFLLGSHWLMRRRAQTGAETAEEVGAPRAELAEANRALEAERAAAADLRQALAEAETRVQATGGEHVGDEPDGDPNRIARLPARAEVQRLLQRYGEAVDAELISALTGVTDQHARKLLRQERGRTESNDGRRPHLVQVEAADPATAAVEMEA